MYAMTIGRISAGNNTGCTNNYNWATFIQDMNGSLVDMTVGSRNYRRFQDRLQVITTKTKKVYNYSYTKTISEKPAKLNIFFTGENSYIDGSSIATGMRRLLSSFKRSRLMASRIRILLVSR